MLFTGDSLWLDGEEWIAAVLDDSDREAYIDSLERLKTVEFDYLVPWGASADGPWYARSRPGQARRGHRAAAARRGPLTADCSQRSSSALTANAIDHERGDDAVHARHVVQRDRLHQLVAEAGAGGEHLTRGSRRAA